MLHKTTAIVFSNKFVQSIAFGLLIRLLFTSYTRISSLTLGFTSKTIFVLLLSLFVGGLWSMWLDSLYYALIIAFSFKVIGFEPRPLLKISPPSESTDKRTKVYNYLEAIKSLPTNFTPSEISSIMSKVNPRLYTHLRETFVVIDDDMEKVNKSGRPTAQSAPSSSSIDPSSEPPVTGSNAVPSGSKSKRGTKRTTEVGVNASSKSARAQ